MAEFNSYKTCNFCGKGEDKVMSMFSSGIYNICDECVCTCYNMIYGPASGQQKNNTSSDRNRKEKDKKKTEKIFLTNMLLDRTERKFPLLFLCIIITNGL